VPLCIEDTGDAYSGTSGAAGNLVVINSTVPNSCPGAVLFTSSEVVTGDTFASLFTTFEPDIFGALMLALFAGMAAGIAGGLVLNVFRKGKRL